MRTVPVFFWAALLFAAGMLPASAQVAKLYPVDEAVQDSSLLLFRLRLIEALVGQDTAFVYEHLAPEVKVSFGDTDGIDSFRAIWQPEAPDSPSFPSLLADQQQADGTDFSYQKPPTHPHSHTP